MNTRLNIIAVLAAFCVYAGALAQETAKNEVFVVDETISFVLHQPESPQPALFIIMDTRLRKEIAAWLTNDTPRIYISGVGEYYVGSVCMSTDRAVITLAKL